MKKNIRLLIIGTILLSLLLAIMLFLLFNNSKNKTSETDSLNNTQTESPSKIFDKSPNDINSINVTNQSGTFSIEIDYSNNEQPLYKINNIEHNKQASQSILKSFIDELINLVPSKVVDEQTEDLEKYGLNNSIASINITFKNSSNKLIKLGNEAPLSLGNYLSLDEEKKVYLLPNYNTEIFTNPKEYYLENKS